MRIIPIIALLVLAAAPAAAQGIVVPLRCEGACPADGRLPRSLAMDTVRVWGNVLRGHATIYVDHVVRNQTAGTLDGAFFFPLPPGAAIHTVSVFEGEELERYGDWSGPGESRRMLEEIVRERPDAGLREYAGTGVVHVEVPSIPPRGSQRVQIVYTQPLRAVDGTLSLRYPLSVGASVVDIGHLSIGFTVTTAAGFRDLRSPSHAVDVQPGTESARCPREMRCGYRGVTSHRVKIVRLRQGHGDRTRDFEILYTPEDAAAERRSASIP